MNGVKEKEGKRRKKEERKIRRRKKEERKKEECERRERKKKEGRKRRKTKKRRKKEREKANTKLFLLRFSCAFPVSTNARPPPLSFHGGLAGPSFSLPRTLLPSTWSPFLTSPQLHPPLLPPLRFSQTRRNKENFAFTVKWACLQCIAQLQKHRNGV